MSLKDQVTPEEIYKQRRLFLKASIYAGSAAATIGAYRFFRPAMDSEEQTIPVAEQAPEVESPLTPTAYRHITNYNNFYEFSTDKEEVAQAVGKWQINNWALKVDGLVENPLTFSLADLGKIQTEERIYRFRCVEGWSMVIPWIGFPLEKILAQAKPLSNASYVAFESYFNEIDMPGANSSGIQFPYVEGLRLDEAMHPLTLMATGLYQKPMPKQNGAPIRLVVPWKYGFKSIKSVVKITVTDREPPTTWNIAIPNEYGFYSNVNPEVDHPRWSQAKERRIGELGTVPTKKFNGYADEVEKLYAGMDLRKYF